MANQATRLVPNTQPKITSVPTSWPMNVASGSDRSTAKIPKIPTVPCTEIAPTGSSILSLSRPMMLNTTSAPPIAPMIVASSGLGSAGSAVIATRPASAPLSAIVRSALPNRMRATNSAAINPPAAAAFVLRKTLATSFATPMPPSLSVEPPLNPNQPIQRMNVPSVAIGRFAPGIACAAPVLALYFPRRAPRSKTPARAAEAPAR